MIHLRPFYALFIPVIFVSACGDTSGDDDDDTVAGVATLDPDLDGDGFEPPEDCDETNIGINPDGTETCNGVDDNCDGNVDEDSSSNAGTWYEDNDNDSFGDPNTETRSCSVLSGYVANHDDCDDSDGEVNPNADEVCGDGIDNNCDESGNNCGLTGDIDVATADAVFYGIDQIDHAGSRVAPAGDINQDGISDVIVTAPYQDVADVGASVGVVYLVFGSKNPTDSLQLSSANAMFTGAAEYDQAGVGISAAGDINGDKKPDLLVSTPYWDGETAGSCGITFVLYGPFSGTKSLLNANASYYGEVTYDQSGSAVSGGEDIDKDGFADIVIGARAMDESESIKENGGAYVVLGGSLSGSHSLAEADAQMVGEMANGSAGWAVELLRDFNDDGYADVAVGAPGVTAPITNAEGEVVDSIVGATYILFGPVAGNLSLSDADVKITGISEGSEFGKVLNEGDFNNDGVSDLIVGAPSDSPDGKSTAGAAYVFFGPREGNLTADEADVIIEGARAQDGAANDVGSAGDLDSDGNEDLVVSAYGNSRDERISPTRTVYLVYGPLQGTIDLGDIPGTITSKNEDEAVGNSASSAGDFNDDGFGDVLVGVPYVQGEDTLPGRVYVFYGDQSY